MQKKYKYIFGVLFLVKLLKFVKIKARENQLQKIAKNRL